MTKTEFLTEIQRIKDNFGPQVYTTDRVGILWKDLMGEDVENLKGAVGHLIASETHAPSVALILEEVRTARLSKLKSNPVRSIDDIDFDSKNVLPHDERIMLLGMITRKVQGRSPPEEVTEIDRMIKNVEQLHAEKFKVCQHCLNSGIINKPKSIYRCRCAKGMQDNRKFPIWRD